MNKNGLTGYSTVNDMETKNIVRQYPMRKISNANNKKQYFNLKCNK